MKQPLAFGQPSPFSTRATNTITMEHAAKWHARPASARMALPLTGVAAHGPTLRQPQVARMVAAQMSKTSLPFRTSEPVGWQGTRLMNAGGGQCIKCKSARGLDAGRYSVKQAESRGVSMPRDRQAQRSSPRALPTECQRMQAKRAAILDAPWYRPVTAPSLYSSHQGTAASITATSHNAFPVEKRWQHDRFAGGNPNYRLHASSKTPIPGAYEIPTSFTRPRPRLGRNMKVAVYLATAGDWRAI